MAVCVVAICGELSLGEVSGSVFFSMRDLSGSELPGEKCPYWSTVRWGTLREELSGGGIYRSPYLPS